MRRENEKDGAFLWLMLDTCVWIDLARDYRQRSFLEAFAYMAGGDFFGLILPQTVIDEFNNNTARIIEESGKGTAQSIKRVKEAVAQLGDKRRIPSTLNHLSSIEHKLTRSKETVTDAVATVQKLFRLARIVEASDEIMLRAARRGIGRRAPFHRERNSMNDAIIIESYAEAAKPSKDEHFAFVTHNVKDFSALNADQRLPHPDIAELFGDGSTYAITLLETLRAKMPESVEGFQEMADYEAEPRSFNEILDAENELFDKVWYNRHKNLMYKVNTGEVRIVKDNEWTAKDSQTTITRSTLKVARAAGVRMRKKRGAKNLGPWDDFEWGMLNGKLSALRWVIGYEWDMLDT